MKEDQLLKFTFFWVNKFKEIFLLDDSRPEKDGGKGVEAVGVSQFEEVLQGVDHMEHMKQIKVQ